MQVDSFLLVSSYMIHNESQKKGNLTLMLVMFNAVISVVYEMRNKAWVSKSNVSSFWTNTFLFHVLLRKPAPRLLSEF